MFKNKRKCNRLIHWHVICFMKITLIILQRLALPYSGWWLLWRTWLAVPYKSMGLLRQLEPNPTDGKSKGSDGSEVFFSPQLGVPGQCGHWAWPLGRRSVCSATTRGDWGNKRKKGKGWRNGQPRLHPISNCFFFFFGTTIEHSKPNLGIFAAFICVHKVFLLMNVLCESGAETITAPERELFLSQLLIGWSYLPRINKPSSQPHWVESIRVLIRKYDCFILHLTAPVCHMGIHCHFMTTSSTGEKKKQKKMEWEKKKRRGYRRKSLTILNLSLWEGFTRQARRVRLICFSFLFFFLSLSEILERNRKNPAELLNQRRLVYPVCQ